MNRSKPDKLPRHVAIIMDGNGRWAKRKKLKRVEGHSVGIESVREIVSVTCDLQIPYLTLYALSKENWGRPKDELETLLSLLSTYLTEELSLMLEKNIRLNVIGEIDDFPKHIQSQIADAIYKTSQNKSLNLTMALSYSGRWEIVQAARALIEEMKNGSYTDVTEESFSRHLCTHNIPDPDFLIRTSGEMRLSNFLLWQLAYTEIYVTDTLWPDFRKDTYLEALSEFAKRERRFGRVKEI